MQHKPLAIMAEIFLGWIGFLGIGHFILGDKRNGWLILIAWWIILMIMAGAALATNGGALFRIIPAWFLLPIISGLTLRSK
jgi:hypothetical protein